MNDCKSHNSLEDCLTYDEIQKYEILKIQLLPLLINNCSHNVCLTSELLGELGNGEFIKYW